MNAYVVHSRDERRITQNNGICSPGPDGEMYYGQLKEILEFNYLLFKVVLFQVKWFDTRNKVVLSKICACIYCFVHEFLYVMFKCVYLFEYMSADVARSHDGDGRGKGKRKPNLGGRAAGRLNTCDKTRNLSLKEIMDMKGPVPIQFELCDKQTIMPLGDHVAHWSSYIGEVIRGVPLHYPSWLKIPNERKAALITDIRAAHGIPQLDKDQRGHPAALAKGVQYQQGCFQGPSLGYRPHDRDLQCGEDQAGTCRPQPLRSTHRSLTHSSWHTLLTGNSFGMRTDEEMRRLEAMGTYTYDEINRLAIGGKQRGHIAGMGRVLPARVTTSPNNLPNREKKIILLTNLTTFLPFFTHHHLRHYHLRTHHHHHYSPHNPPLLTTEPTITAATHHRTHHRRYSQIAESTSGRAESAAESTAVSTAVSTAESTADQREMSLGNARKGFLPQRQSLAKRWVPRIFHSRIKCHGGTFSPATCRRGN
nr:hypothetical protein [Tanacetum cinerariifolium]